MIEYLEGVGEEWTGFKEGELASSNENNNKTLGGTSKPNDFDDEQDNSYEVQMEKIMARFTNFNQIISQGNSNDDDDDDDDDETTHEDKDQTFDEDDEDTPDVSGSEMKIQKVSLPEEELDKDFTDNNFWRMDSQNSEVDVDSLLSELE